MPHGPGRGGNPNRRRGPGSGGQSSAGTGAVSAQALGGKGSKSTALAASLTVSKAITGAVTAGGLIRITATAHGFDTGNAIYISGVGGTVEANRAQAWVIVRQSANTFDLLGSTFTNAYTSGGTAGRR